MENEQRIKQILEASTEYVKERGYYTGQLDVAFIDGAEWADEHPKEYSVSENLEEAAKHYLYSNILYDDIYVGNPTDKDCIEMFKAGANWQERKDEKNIGELQWNAHAEGWDECKQEMMKDAIDTTIKQGCTELVILIKGLNEDKFSFGDKVKVIVIKED